MISLEKLKGDFIVNDLGILFQIISNGSFYYAIRVSSGTMFDFYEDNIEELLAHLAVIKVIPNEKITLIEEN